MHRRRAGAPHEARAEALAEVGARRLGTSDISSSSKVKQNKRKKKKQ